MGLTKEALELSGAQNSVKAQFVTLVNAVQLLTRVPLAITNLVVVAYMLVLGG